MYLCWKESLLNYWRQYYFFTNFSSISFTGILFPKTTYLHSVGPLLNRSYVLPSVKVVILFVHVYKSPSSLGPCEVCVLRSPRPHHTLLSLTSLYWTLSTSPSPSPELVVRNTRSHFRKWVLDSKRNELRYLRFLRRGRHRSVSSRFKVLRYCKLYLMSKYVNVCLCMYIYLYPRSLNFQ